MNVLSFPVSRPRSPQKTDSLRGGSVTKLCDNEAFLSNRTKHDPLARAAASYLPPPDDSDREPCVRALVATLRFLPSHPHIREEHLEAMAASIGRRNDVIIEEIRAAKNQPNDTDVGLRWTLRCALEARNERGGMARLGVVAILHRLSRLAPCFA